MRLTRTLGLAGALIVAALVGGTLINATLATDDQTDPTGTAYCDVFREALASELGVTTDELTSAGKVAANAAIDAAIAAGDLDEDRAATLRERVEAYDGDGCGLFGRAAAFGRGFGHGFGVGMERGMARGLLGGNVFEAAADALGLTSDELITAFHDAGSLEALAEDQGVAYADVSAAILAAVQADLDAAVEEGLPQDRADEIIERLSSWLDDGGVAGEFGPGGGHRHGPGFRMGPGFPMGPGFDDAEEEDGADTGA